LETEAQLVNEEEEPVEIPLNQRLKVMRLARAYMGIESASNVFKVQQTSL
jgi:hypothetical protein